VAICIVELSQCGSRAELECYYKRRAEGRGGEGRRGEGRAGVILAYGETINCDDTHSNHIELMKDDTGGAACTIVVIRCELIKCPFMYHNIIQYNVQYS
jgi:hypothetical protein